MVSRAAIYRQPEIDDLVSQLSKKSVCGFIEIDHANLMMQLLKQNVVASPRLRTSWKLNTLLDLGFRQLYSTADLQVDKVFVFQ